MGYRNLGPNVSHNAQGVSPGGGQYSAEDHSFESVVFEQGKPPFDWELNLMQEALGAYGYQKNNQRLFPSSWIVGSFLEASDISASYTFPTPDVPGGSTANQFWLAASDVLLNGWPIRFEYSGTSVAGMNLIQLPAPPVSGTRIDFVFLEAWRALVSPAPDTTNKSPTGQILRFGNAKAPDSVGNQNLADDLKDPTFNAESARRVQIQYRYRVVSGIADLASTPDCFEDSLVVANTVPYKSSSGVDGAATSLNYFPSPVDPGLWVAGAGDSTDATTLGTVDGRMYAIPICAVFRRNQTAFNRQSNINGSDLMSIGGPRRPDGLFADQIVIGDVKDLRKALAYDLKEVLDKAFNQVLDGSMSTEHELSTEGGGTSFLARDDIGTSGHIGNPDGVRTHFSDRCVTKSITCKVHISSDSSVNVDLSSLPVYYAVSPFNVGGLAPVGTSIVGVGRIRSKSTTSEEDMLNTSSSRQVTKVVLSSVGSTVDRATLTFNTTLTNVDVFVELLVEYPSGSGIKRNVLSPNQLWTPPAANIGSWVDVSNLSATPIDSNRRALAVNLWGVDPAHRELSVFLQSTIQTYNTFWDGTPYVYIPETVDGGSVTLSYTASSGSVTYSTFTYEKNAGYTRVTLNGANLPSATGNPVTVTYKAYRALPPTAAAPGDSYQLFYTTRAVQSVAVPAGTQTLGLFVRSSSPFLHVITTGSGSPDDGAPFQSPGAQIPVGSLPAASYPEARLNSPNFISVVGLGVNTGYMQLPILIPYVPDPGQVTLYRSASDTTQDGDLRNFWPRSNNPAIPVYTPAVFAQELSSKTKHKVAYPVLMELKQDFPGYGRKGTLLLVVFSKWMEFDAQNSVGLLSTSSDSCAAVYRVRGNMINPRRTV